MKSLWGVVFCAGLVCLSFHAWAESDDKDDEKVDVAKTTAALAKAKVTLVQAFETAGKTVPDGKILGGEIEAKGDAVTIDVDVLKDNAQIEVTIDAVSGKVLKSEPEKLEGKEAKEFEQAKKALPQIKVKLADAIATAEKAVPGGKTFEVALEIEDGKAIVNVSLLAGAKASGVDIDGATGKVLEIEKLATEKSGDDSKKEKAEEKKAAPKK